MNMPCSGCTEASARRAFDQTPFDMFGNFTFFYLSPIATLIGDSELNNHDSDGY